MIKLIKDKSYIHSELKIGTIGEIRSNKENSLYYEIYFPDIGKTFELFENTFEYLKIEEIEKKKINSAFNIRHIIGPRGGFKKLIFEYNNPFNGITIIEKKNKKFAMKLLDFFKKNDFKINNEINY